VREFLRLIGWFLLELTVGMGLVVVPVLVLLAIMEAFR